MGGEGGDNVNHTKEGRLVKVEQKGRSWLKSGRQAGCVETAISIPIYSTFSDWAVSRFRLHFFKNSTVES